MPSGQDVPTATLPCALYVISSDIKPPSVTHDDMPGLRTCPWRAKHLVGSERQNKPARHFNLPSLKSDVRLRARYCTSAFPVRWAVSPPCLFLLPSCPLCQSANKKTSNCPVDFFSRVTGSTPGTKASIPGGRQPSREEGNAAGELDGVTRPMPPPRSRIAATQKFLLLLEPGQNRRRSLAILVSCFALFPRRTKACLLTRVFS